MKRQHLFVIGLVLLVMCLGMQAKTRKGDKLLRDGRTAEAKGDWDTALQFYEQALDQDPADTAYLAAMRKARFETGQKHVDAGQELRASGKLEEAMQEFQKALIADPGSAIALQEIRRIQEILSAPQAGAKPEDRGLTPAERARRDSRQKVESMLQPPELQPMTTMIPSIKMNNQPPRVLYETVAKQIGRASCRKECRL